MSILKLLEGIPINATLRLKIAGLEEENSALKLENSVLKESIAKKDDQIRDLTKALEVPSKPEKPKQPTFKLSGFGVGGNDNMI